MDRTRSTHFVSKISWDYTALETYMQSSGYQSMDLGNRKAQKWPDWTSSGYVFVACFLYYGNEPLGSIKQWNFLLIAECYRNENDITDTSSTLHCRSSAVGIATKLEVWWSRVWIPAESKLYFFFSKTHRSELRPTGLLFSGWRHGSFPSAKRLGCEVDHSFPNYS